MSRSLKKGPFLAYHLMKKIENSFFSGQIIIPPGYDEFVKNVFFSLFLLNL